VYVDAVITACRIYKDKLKFVDSLMGVVGLFGQMV
jgi:hypothetical protein